MNKEDSFEHVNAGDDLTPSEPHSPTTDTTPPSNEPSAPDNTNPVPPQSNTPKTSTPPPTTDTQTPPSTPPSTLKSDAVLKEIEEAAAAGLAATKEATTKLLNSAEEAKDKFSSFIGGLWSSLDAPGSAQKRAATEQDNEKLQQYLGLASDESVLESFRCKLIQTYTPSNNNITAKKSVSFTCQLHIATLSVVVELDSDKTSPPARFTAKEISGYNRDGDNVHISLTEDRSIVLGSFSIPKLEVDSVLTLLENLVESADDTEAA